MTRLPRPGARWSRRWTVVAGVIPVALLVVLLRGVFDLLGGFALGVGLGCAIAVAAKLLGRLWTWAAVLLVYGLALGLVPLFDVLGYELAIATTLLAAPLGLDLGSAFARELARGPVSDRGGAFAVRALVRSTVVAVALVLVLLLIPAVIAAVRGSWRPTCDWGFGIEAYVYLPMTTGALAAMMGHAIGVLVGPRRVWCALVAIAVPLILVAFFALWRFFAAPPVFTYNAVLGYFPGNLYDENIELGSALAWSRLEQLAWVLAVLALAAWRLDVPSFRAARAPRPAGRRIGAPLVAATCVAGALALHAHGGELGYAIDSEDIAEALGGRLETEHFVIHYADTEEIRKVIDVVARDHEFRYAQVVATLGAAPAGKIGSYYFATRDQKARWMGARDVEMAKPWRREIYLEHRPFPHGSLRHEIAHAVASEFGDPWLGIAARRVLGLPIAISPGLIEGLAVAADWPGDADRLSPHESVRVLQALGKQPTIGQLLSLQFFKFSSSAGYQTAGSFLRFLLERYGASNLRALYGSGGEFAGVYGKPLAALEGEWREMISTIELPASTIEATRERFRVGGVFSRPCPHAIAARLERARDARARGDRKGALRLLRDVCRDAPEEPRYRLRLGETLIGGDDAERAEAIDLWTALALDHEHGTPTLRADAYENLVRVAAARNDLAEVRRLVEATVKLPLMPNERRQPDANAIALAHTGPAGAALRGYFFDPGGIDNFTWAHVATLAEPELGFTHYLLGLQYLRRGDLAGASGSLSRALALGLPSQPFTKNAARQLAIAAYRTNDAAGVKRAADALTGPGMSTSDRLLGRDWMERLAFDAGRPPAITSPR
ncbi:MAG TPA: hypothetical protein VM513_31280 [Kofleriaceae bacterium]|nr:hypothetical protein [Kofleriaceae bacterium]